MIKRFIYTLLVLLTVIFSSCKKETYHRIKFELEIIENCDNCFADVFLVDCFPQYTEDAIGISKSDMVDGYVWSYEYWSLKDGDDIVFSASPTKEGYRFKLNIYIDNVLVSYRECYGPYGVVTIDEWGINNNEQELGIIEFTYYE
jgi:hypothetical protein